ncbi:MAG: hypothetical protein EH225_09145 [Calditrichaeota bacterium]|nr:hypothetical protein [Calditrichota bacterium]RQW01881.1 MAG: hypothetical protein EH225_09145 [Calditrichota bacterium]
MDIYRIIDETGKVLWVSVIVFCLAFAFRGDSELFCQDTTLINFSLKDQFNNHYSNKNFEGNIVILVGSDHEGSEYNETWSLAIYDSLKEIGLEDSVKFLPVADLRGVPFFLKGFVRSKFPSDYSKWILMDWSGKFARSYDFSPDASNIILFDRKGNLIYHMTVTNLDRKRLKKFMGKLLALPDFPQKGA